MSNTFKPTPGTAAKAWAQANPSETAEIKTVSLTPGGRGGWLTKTKRMTFFAVEGKCAAMRSARGGCANGRCWVCGGLFLEQVLRSGNLPDPEAGAALPAEERTTVGDFYELNGWQSVRAPKAWLEVCPDCAARLGITEWGYVFTESDREQKILHAPRIHPLAVYARAAPDVLVLINLLDVHAGRATEPTIKIVRKDGEA
jgi:hypothetical protein